jgi:fructokinase
MAASRHIVNGRAARVSRQGPAEGAAVTILVWGELLWDLFPDGAQLGGAPANVAWHLGQLGARPRLVTRVGADDHGRAATARMAGAGVDVALIQVDGERATGVVEVAVEAGEPRYRLVPGRAWERIACGDDVRAALGDAAAIVFGTLAQRTDDGLAAWRELMAAAPAGCLRVCDPNLRPGHFDRRAIEAALAAADVVKLNDGEVAACQRELGLSDPVGWLLERGARLVAITHGARGSTLVTADQRVAIAGVASAAGGDNVGCGDAYLAVLVHGIVAGWPLARTGRLASAWACAVAGRRGGTPAFTGEEIAGLFAAAGS